MGYAENRGEYWRAHYKTGDGRGYALLKDADGNVIRFKGKRQAKKAADEREAKMREGEWRDPAKGKMLFGEYVSRWYEAQDLARSTMQNYRRHIEEHLLPTFGAMEIGEIEPLDIAKWEKAERAVYAWSSVKTWRSTLHLILADAVDAKLRDANPAARRRGRGRRDGRSRNRGPEKVVTGALGTLLIAERASLLSGRDDEFVALVLKGFTGMRWGELVGLETEFVRPNSVRIEWQLYELDTGEFDRKEPKDDSRRPVDLTSWLARLTSEHIVRTDPQPCICHGRKYVFRAHRPANGAGGQVGAKLVDVARVAGVSTGTVSTVLNHPETVPEKTRTGVQKAVADLGYVRGGRAGEFAPHWRRNGFATWLFRPAATGWYPRKAPHDPHPVPVLADPWPGIPVRGRNAAERGQACWLPIAPGLTPHGLRHSHKTMMEELGIPPKLMDERMGHEDGSVQARYSHVTAEMRRRLLAGLTEIWEAALEERRRMSFGSPVAVLDRLLRGKEE